MSRKSNTPYDRGLHRGLRSKQIQSIHDLIYEQETMMKYGGRTTGMSTVLWSD